MLKQDKGLDTVEANEILGFAPDAREYDIAAGMLEKTGREVAKTDDQQPEKTREACRMWPLTSLNVCHISPKAHPHNEYYLATKSKKFGHML